MIAVKFYGTNAAGVPTDWPSETLDIASAGQAPAGWTVMTDAQYVTYRAARQASFTAWERGRQLAAAKADASAAVDAMAARFASIQDGTLKARINAATKIEDVATIAERIA